MPDRPQIRNALRQRRLNLSSSERQQFSILIQQKIIILPEFQQSQHIAFYLANDGEVDPSSILITAELQQKQCYLPVLSSPQKDHLEFYTYHSNDPLIKNQFAIGEPDIKKQHYLATQDLDCAFLPLVGFDTKGNRLGRGAGYYDRTFAFLLNSIQKKPILIGLAYEFQK